MPERSRSPRALGDLDGAPRLAAGSAQLRVCDSTGRPAWSPVRPQNGRSEAETLAARGAAVLCVDIANTDDVVASIRAASGEAESWTGDITSAHAAEEILVVAGGLNRPVTCLVNNAGRVEDRMTYNLSDEHWDDILAVNLTATFRLSRAFSRHWRHEPHAHDRRIINTTSESGPTATRVKRTTQRLKPGWRR